MRTQIAIITATAVLLILLPCASASSIPTENKEQSLKTLPSNRLLSKENVDVFKFWLGIDTWADILAWLFVGMRYIGFIMIIVGCLISGPGKNNGWTRFIRYVSFIYGTTYFYFNFIVSTKDDTVGIKTESFLMERSNFNTIYMKYFEKSTTYLFSFERFEIFKNVVASKDNLIVDITDIWNERFYEGVIYLIATLLSWALRGGATNALKASGFAHKMRSLRVAFSLALGPGLLAHSLHFQATYWYYANDFKATLVGKDIAFGQFWCWVVMALVILVDWIILLTSGLKDTISDIDDELKKEKSKILPIFVTF